MQHQAAINNLANVRAHIDTYKKRGLQPYTAGNERMYRLAADPTATVSDEVGECEKCGRRIVFQVTVIDRPAYWCGCAN